MSKHPCFILSKAIALSAGFDDKWVETYLGLHMNELNLNLIFAIFHR